MKAYWVVAQVDKEMSSKLYKISILLSRSSSLLHISMKFNILSAYSDILYEANDEAKVSIVIVLEVEGFMISLPNHLYAYRGYPPKH